MSDTDYIPSNMDAITETQAGNDSPKFVATPTTETQVKNRAKKKQFLHQEKELALHSDQQVHEPKSVENENEEKKKLEEFIAEYLPDLIVVAADEPVKSKLNL